MLFSLKQLENGCCILFLKNKTKQKTQFSAVSNIPFWPRGYENCLCHYICILEFSEGQGDGGFLGCMLQKACMCENAVYFLMMIEDYSVTKVLKTTQCYNKTKENAMNLVGTYHRAMNKALSFEVLNALPSPNILFTREGQLVEISLHMTMRTNFQSTFFKVKLPTGSGSSPTEISNSAQERELYTTIAVQILCLEFNSIDYLLSRVWRPSLTLLNSLTSKYVSTIQYSNYLYTQCFTNLEHHKFRYEKCPVILYHFYLHWIRKLNQDNSSRYRASFNQDNGCMLKGYVKRIIFLTIKSILVP